MPSITIEVSNIRILTDCRGPDIIWIDTTLPDGAATLEMRVAAGTGIEYVKKHFGVEPINLSEKRKAKDAV